MEIINSNLIFLRRKNNKKQKEMADFLQITASAWNNWEKGISFPKIQFIIDLSNYFEVTTDELLTVDLSKVPLSGNNEDKKKQDESTPKSTPNSTPKLYKTEENQSIVAEPKATYGGDIWQEKYNSVRFQLESSQEVVSAQKMLIDSLQAQIKLLESVQ